MNQISTFYKYILMISALALSFASYSGTNHISDTTGVVYGCMDSTSLNYNPYATVSDGSCIADTSSGAIYGCTDPNAFNYNPYATVNNGTCNSGTDTTLVFGCTDPASLSYNPSATINDGSCKYNTDTTTIYGCMDPLAYNYNALANNADNSCLYKQITINSTITIVKSELQDTVGTVLFDNCVINYSLPINNAYIDNLTTIGKDSVQVLWAIVQNDGTKSVSATYKVQTTGKQLFVLSITCSQNPTARITAAAPKVNTFGDVAEVFTITGTSNKALATNGVKLFPQPADNSVSYTVQEAGNLSVFNLFGESVLTVEINVLAGEISLANLAQGTYIYRFTGKSGQSVGKIVKR